MQLIEENGSGKNPAQQAVKRITAREFIAARLKYIEPCVEFNPHSACVWDSETRLAEIQALCSKVMELGDVSKNKNNNKNNNNNAKEGDEAEPTDGVNTLVTNEETRWTSKAMKHRASIIQHPEEHEVKTLSTEEIVGKARLIMNKLSWTTLDRLTDKLVLQTDITNNAEVRAAVIEMVVSKAQTQPHFGAMYAQLCANISKQFKPFKKELLTACQHEFETKTDDKITEATKGVIDPEEINYHATLIRKAYVGHMRFLGELYMRDVVKLAIILHCLDDLLKDEEHEESLECFAMMMTTMGSKLDPHAKQNGKPFDWEKVVAVRHHMNISNRIKFLLQDLLDLKDNGKSSWDLSCSVGENEELAANALFLLYLIRSLSLQDGSRGVKKIPRRRSIKSTKKSLRKNNSPR